MCQHHATSCFPAEVNSGSTHGEAITSLQTTYTTCLDMWLAGFLARALAPTSCIKPYVPEKRRGEEEEEAEEEEEEEKSTREDLIVYECLDSSCCR